MTCLDDEFLLTWAESRGVRYEERRVEPFDNAFGKLWFAELPTELTAGGFTARQAILRLYSYVRTEELRARHAAGFAYEDIPKQPRYLAVDPAGSCSPELCAWAAKVGAVVYALHTRVSRPLEMPPARPWMAAIGDTHAAMGGTPCSALSQLRARMP